MAIVWDQTRFDDALRQAIEQTKAQAVPGLINRKAFWVALKAMKYTPKVDRERIARELATVVHVHRKGGGSGDVPIGWVIAAKRASKGWQEAKMARGQRSKRRTSALKLWRARIKKTFEVMLGKRVRSAGFMKSGWLTVIRRMSRYGGSKAQSYKADAEGIKTWEPPKGRATPAVKSDTPFARIESSAASRRDKTGGFIRKGSAALKKAFDEEAASMIQHMESTLKPIADEFNRGARAPGSGAMPWRPWPPGALDTLGNPL